MSLKVTATQMEAAPAPLEARLQRAEALVAQGADEGSRIVVLPELFNLGYAYTAENYRRVEPPDGPTTSWMQECASRYQVYLAGTLLAREQGEIFNRLLLVSPAGQTWHYDKTYPWGWERAYFRGAPGIRVAETPLGRIGMLICWDVAHPALWRQYAGKVDWMLISSCPPDVSTARYHMPDGRTLTLRDLGALLKRVYNTGQYVFGENVRAQAAWLGVPAVFSTGCGQVETPLPNPRGTLLSLGSLRPGLWRHLGRADAIRMQADLVSGCRIYRGAESPLEAAPAGGEMALTGEIHPPETRPTPKGVQPQPRIPWMAYFSSDILLPTLTAGVYRRNKT
ncbi:MAG: hypothetical protein Fur0018_19150 [Anaerolineales bacterium]